ncbi:MAG: hypothetical protein U0Q55_03370 [Vicinamibacterales bacterium]
MKRTLPALAAAALLLVSVRAQQPATSQQPNEVSTTISSDQAGSAPRFAVPDFIALSKDAETVDAAQTIGRVLWDDLNFEREFALIPRDVLATIPPATSLVDIPFDRYREINADGIIIGAVQKTELGVRVEVRLFNRNRQSVFSREYSGSVGNKRLYAHTIADELHQQQRALRGVARTKLTFNSDRDGERMAGTVENRGVKEIYIADYDGENQRRVTTQRSLNINSTWSPDARSIAYTSYRRGAPTIFISNIYQGTLDEPTKGAAGQAFLPAWSPDGTRIAFTSTRDGNSEIYVANRDGSNVRRITNSAAIDSTPTWSPTGTQIAFTSDRYRHAADLHRGRGWAGAAPADTRVVCGPADLVAGALQRGRVHGAHGSGQRHQGHRTRDRPGQAADVRGRHEREPGVLGQRPPHCLHVHPVRQVANLHHQQGRQGPPSDHADRQQLPARLVQVATRTLWEYVNEPDARIPAGDPGNPADAVRPDHRGVRRQETSGGAPCPAATDHGSEHLRCAAACAT